MMERRLSNRDVTKHFGVQCEVKLQDGTTLYGVVADCSEGGLRVLGDAQKLRIGDEVEMIFLYPSGEKVGHRGSVQHLAHDGSGYGVRFDSDPIPIIVHRESPTAPDAAS